jgi:hypothetical protein
MKEMMVIAGICIGLFAASVSGWRRNEAIEICITFQVPLIFHLDVGCSFCLMAIPSLRGRALKYFRKRILEKSIKL